MTALSVAHVCLAILTWLYLLFVAWRVKKIIWMGIQKESGI